MISNNKLAKANRKQKRCQAIISNELGIPSSDEPTKFLGVCNAGLSTGLQEESLLAEAQLHGKVLNVLMIPNKSYCFLECASLTDSVNIMNGLHVSSKLGQNDTVLYLSYFVSLPENIENPWDRPMPNGLIIIENFVDADEESLLIASIADNDKVDGVLKHRLVTHFGYEFLYGTNNVNPDVPLERQIPNECQMLWPRLEEQLPNLNWYRAEQLTVNEYQPGQGIPPHVDTHSAFLDPILSLSLESDIVMEFKRNNERVCVLLPRRSLLVMSGEARYDWVHGITPRHMDVIPTPSNGLTIKPRSKRTSLTFRKLRRTDCDCSYPKLCDSRANSSSSSIKLEKIAAELEVSNVHKVYDQIANHFSETRHSPWPKVAEFIRSFEEGSILLDVGCGNGKYLGINDDILEIGCDRSEGLLKVCSTKKQNVFKCDCLSVPFRSSSVDGCISIAVIHHLATEERRLKALSEMARVLKPKGRALIYVWARNQKANANKSSYLRQNKAVNKNKKSESELRDITSQTEHFPQTEVNLPIHTNRTEFLNQDVFVPWKLKGSQQLQSDSNVFLRYYHVFEETELDKLCERVGDIKIVEVYYDQGNHCVIFEKL